jgi:DNA-binding beta-propeller fold protein YncE
MRTATLERSAPLAPADAEALFKEAKRIERRRRLFKALLVIVLIVLAGGVLVGILLRSGPNPRRSTSTANARAPRRFPVRRASNVTTAYVVDAGGLVPVDLSTDRAEPAVQIPDFSFTGGWSDLAVSSDGRTAYAVTSPVPSRAGLDLAGPSIVSIDLLTRRIEGRISFSASAVQADLPGSQASFYIDALAITPDGRTVLVADAADNTLIPIDVASHRVGHPIALPSQRSLSSPIGTDRSPGYYPRAPAPISDLVVSPDGRTAYVVDGYAVVPVNLVDGRAEKAITGFDGPQQMTIASDGKTAYVTNPYCWEVIRTGQCQGPPRHPIAEPNGRIQLAAVGDHVSMVDLSNDRIVRNINVGKWSEPQGVALSPSGSTLYLTYGKYGRSGDYVGVVDPLTGKTVARIADGLGSPNGGTDQVVVTPNGREAFLSAFQVVTGFGPTGPVVFRGVVPIDLRTGVAAKPISFGAPEPSWLSTGAVIFGQ